MQLADAPLADTQFIEDFQYREKIGCLIFLMICIRPDLAFIISFLARFCDKVSKVACSAVTRLLHYVYNTRHFELRLGGNEAYISIFADSDWAGCRITRNSTGGFIIYLGFGPIAWGSKLQKAPAQSVAEAEYVTMLEPMKIAQWVRWLLKQTNVPRITSTLQYSSALFGDNTASHAMALNPIASSRSKHIALKYHYIRYLVENNVAHLVHCSSEANKADITTKVFGKRRVDEMTPAALGHDTMLDAGTRKKTKPSDEYA